MDKNKNLNTAAKTPPQNIEAEVSLLGALLLDQEAITKIADIVTDHDFYQPSHQLIFKAIADLYERRQPIDILTLSNRLKDMGEIEKVGGSTYVTSLLNSVPSAAHVVNYAEIVAHKATLRRLISAANDIVGLGYDEVGKVEDLLDKAEQTIFQVSQKHLRQNFTPIKNVLAESFDRIDELHKDKDKLRGVPTGFKDLDNKLAGLQNSDLIIVAARPSMGKTSLALNMAQHVAVKEGIPVGIFSLEMSKEQLIDRLISTEAAIDSWKLRTGNLDDSDFPRINQAMASLSEAPIFIDDSAMANVMEMRTKARRLQSEHGLGLLIVDYLQLMSGRATTDNRVQEISEISRSLKALARELDVPLIALSQLSRAVESRPSRVPQLSDLRESGSIEQDADVVLFIYREDVYDPESDRKGVADIIVSKHRNGPTGQVELFFKGEFMQFKNLDRKRQAEEMPSA